MTMLSIGRLTATLPESPDEHGLAPRAEDMLADATGRRLDESLAAWPLPPGHWFLRRLALQLPLDPRQAGSGTGRLWADVIAAALHKAIDSGQAVHYGSECDALADLMASAAVGNFGNEWAWREFGLVDSGFSGHPGRAVLAAFGRRPELALPALSVAAGRSGAGAVHRLLGSSGWLELARLVYQAYSSRPPPTWLANPGAAMGHAAAGGGPAGSPEQAFPAAPPAPEVAIRVRRVADGELARRFRQARIRPDPSTALAWAVLAAAATDQGLLMQSGAEPALLHLAATLLPGGVAHADPGSHVGGRAAAASPGTAASPGGPGQVTADAAGNRQTAPNATADQIAADAAEPHQVTADAAKPHQVTADAAGKSQGTAGTAEATQVMTGNARIATVAAPAEPGSTMSRQAPRGTGGRSPGGNNPALEPDHDSAQRGWPSAWAGVFHLYRTAAEADVPAALLADGALTARPLAWVLHAIACHLVPAAPGDPALLAFAGLLPTDAPPPRAWRPADKPELDSIADHAHRWLAVTAQRLLHDGAASAETVERLLHRRGTLFAERGWIDVEMPLSEVDIDIRRAGLDIDPGWIGWLGSVVKFRYV
jgi:hypothetical protein